MYLRTVGSFLNQLTSLLTLWVGAFLLCKNLTIGQLIAFRIISGYVVGPLLNLYKLAELSKWRFLWKDLVM